jgi:hypothetical protein
MPAPNPIGENGGELHYTIGFRTHAEIAVYSNDGALVGKLIDEVLPAGRYSVRIHPEDFPSGTYMIKMTAGPYSESRSVVIRK